MVDLLVDCEMKTMSNVKNNAASQETRRKLIEAAGEVYAQKGLHAATIKEITAKAGVNCAAINYHFRDKFELYAAVVRHALKTLQVPEAVENLPGTPEQRLEAMIAEMFRKPTKWPVMKQLILKDIDDLVIDSLGIVAFISFFVGGVITIQTALNIENPLIPRYLVGFELGNL